MWPIWDTTPLRRRFPLCGRSPRTATMPSLPGNPVTVALGCLSLGVTPISWASHYGSLIVERAFREFDPTLLERVARSADNSGLCAEYQGLLLFMYVITHKAG